MSTPPKDGKGFAGLSGWVVDNQADLSLAKSAVRRAEAPPKPAKTPPPLPSTAQTTKATPASTTSASPQPSQGMSGGAVVGLVIIGLIVVLAIAAGVNEQSHEYGADSAADAAAAAADAAAATASSAGGSPAFDPVPAYVTAENANIRSGAGGSFSVVGTLPQMSQVMVIGREGSWSRVQATVDGAPLDGYVSAKLLHEGGAEEARAIVCDVMKSARPYSGEVLLQNSYGGHHLTVNAGVRDALVKLRSGGVTSLAFYVRAGESGTVESVPNGTYQIMFATGEGFSRKCLEFVTSMDVISDPSPQTFEVTSDGYSEYYSTATYTLTTQAGGNFAPQTVDDNSFRE
mgnify:CR=1 FL=1